MVKYLVPALFFLQVVLPSESRAQEEAMVSDSAIRSRIVQCAASLFNGNWFSESTGYQKPDSTTIDTIVIDNAKQRIRVVADDRLSWSPARWSVVDSMERSLLAASGLDPEEYSLEIHSAGRNLREYVPNFFRPDAKVADRERSLGRLKRKQPPLVRALAKPYLTDAALYNINIALWHSHGWYYEPSLHRWEWQRARIFQTVEDLLPMAFTLQMLVPMLENAGAGVFLPRERDWQVHEVIVDNDGSTGKSLYVSTLQEPARDTGTGFGIGHPPYVEENPFRLGTYQEMLSEKEATSTVQWIPDIPETGDYAVYVSFHSSAENAEEVRYRVHHAGGISDFSVNQRMGGGTWVYLGRFRFNRGLDPAHSKVEMTNQGRQRKARITADAVRFGGGMGNIARNGLTGMRPRYQEAARYYLQYAGFPDTLVWKLNTPEHDYKDDYQSRGEWVSYMSGTPGLGIPIDLALAFHTDAGIAGGDTVIGTLGIFSTNNRKGPFPSGLSRMSSRDLADLVVTQVVEDLRALYDPEWTRRALWDKPYSEAVRPSVPTMMLELASHQNFLDVRFGQEPMFRFHTSRAVYKGIMKYLGSLYGTGYVVQPLPVTHFATEILPGGEVRLSWRPAGDPLESTAVPDCYRVYTRVNKRGFDNGVTVEDTTFVLQNCLPDSIYSFMITALNRGGESFPSEVLSVCNRREPKGRVLVINAFDRTGGAAWFDDSRYAGFLPMVDQGVPFHVDLHTVGTQFEYRKSSPWLDDDSPGHGASYAELEERVIPGNTFDFPFLHGTSISSAGYSFVSASDEAIEDGLAGIMNYAMVDFIAGEEKSSFLPKNDSIPLFQVLSDRMFRILGDYLGSGGGLFISGAHIAGDIHFRGQDDSAASLLKFRWRTDNASRLGGFYFMDPGFAGYTDTFHFNTATDPVLYTAEGADALEPADSTSFTLARYRENNMSAAVAFRDRYGVVAMGFPFETIIGQQARDQVMDKVIHYLLKDGENE